MTLKDYISELQKVEAMYGDIPVMYQTLTHRFAAEIPAIRTRLKPSGKGEEPFLLINP